MLNPHPTQINFAVHPKITVGELRRRWGKFDETDLASIKSIVDLVTQVQAKYGLDKTQAQDRVNLWVDGRDF